MLKNVCGLSYQPFLFGDRAGVGGEHAWGGVHNDILN